MSDETTEARTYCAAHGGNLRSHIKPEGHCVFLIEDFTPPCVPAVLVQERVHQAQQAVIEAAALLVERDKPVCGSCCWEPTVFVRTLADALAALEAAQQGDTDGRYFPSN